MNITNHFIENYTFTNKNVIIRVDWNIPYNDNYEILDYFRITSSLESINYINNQNPKRIIIISHLGRPTNTYNKLYSWSNFIEQIKIKTNFQNLILLEDGLSEITLNKLKLNRSNIYLLENIRFHPEETNFSKNITTKEHEIFNKLGDIFVNDAFSCMHRYHLSICGFNKNDEKAYGYLVKKELDYLQLILNNKTDKILGIIGGCKIDDKMPLLKNLSNQINGIYIAGGLINSILKEKSKKQFLENIKNNKAQIYEMKDGLASENQNNFHQYYLSNNLPLNKYFYDIGELSLKELEYIINDYDIIFWNGPLGLIENHLFKNGSERLIEILIKSKKRIIIGGGDTAAFINSFEKLYNINFEFISTAGGALIDFISNKTLVGLEYFLS